MTDVTRILSAIEQGGARAAEQLLPLVYDELRKLAAQKLAQEKPGQTLEATALVHEAYVRLVGGGEERHWDSRGHFFAAAADPRRQGTPGPHTGCHVPSRTRHFSICVAGRVSKSMEHKALGRCARCDDTLLWGEECCVPAPG